MKPYLKLVLAKIKLMKEQGGPLETVVVELNELYDELMGLQGKRAGWDPVCSLHPCPYRCRRFLWGQYKADTKRTRPGGNTQADCDGGNYAIGPLGGLDSPEGRIEFLNRLWRTGLFMRSGLMIVAKQQKARKVD
ncbi:hypothetical protein [Paenibacillus agricola]|uniref:Uncharacterized protein n=1 Tax=Paenibacillus agricola TaxID=2716264 RepID=A0ABX0JIW2_9BACL|nr:hypothetical protein [Paenibacillus agricola]NHN35568.1 hypothetical protein [Paenibacillus agricola]